MELGVWDGWFALGAADAEAGGGCWCCHENSSTSLGVLRVRLVACEVTGTGKTPRPCCTAVVPAQSPDLPATAAPPSALLAGVDYYRTQLVVPKDAYELNFVFSNGDGLYDNNGTQVGGVGGWAAQGQACCCCSATLQCTADGRVKALREIRPAGQHCCLLPLLELPVSSHPPTHPSLLQNYVMPVAGPMTRDLWIDTAPERAVSLLQRISVVP